jgi:pyruvate-ferredoxin/flavodoxin oxidoreductase
LSERKYSQLTQNNPDYAAELQQTNLESAKKRFKMYEILASLDL